MAFNSGYYTRSRIHIVDTLGIERRLMPADEAIYEKWPRFSPDGAWVYFSAGAVRSNYDINRIRPDGTGQPERVNPPWPPPPLGYYNMYWQVEPSPDGLSLLYVDGGYYLHRFDLQTTGAEAGRLAG